MNIRPAIHHTPGYIERAGHQLYGIDRLHITGGEPLSHPGFDKIVPKLREWFGCRVLTLQTNCFQVQKHAETLRHFDHIYPSLYENNAAEVEFVTTRFPSTVWPHGEAGFTPRSRRGTGKGCFRGASDTVAYADGKLHGCCVAPGIPEAVGIEPTADWRGKIVAADLPCSNCWFSE